MKKTEKCNKETVKVQAKGKAKIQTVTENQQKPKIRNQTENTSINPSRKITILKQVIIKNDACICVVCKQIILKTN